MLTRKEYDTQVLVWRATRLRLDNALQGASLTLSFAPDDECRDQRLDAKETKSHPDSYRGCGVLNATQGRKSLDPTNSRLTVLDLLFRCRLRSICAFVRSGS